MCTCTTLISKNSLAHSFLIQKHGISEELPSVRGRGKSILQFPPRFYVYPITCESMNLSMNLPSW